MSEPYVPPPLNCPHGRQTCHCAVCAPAAEQAYRDWKARAAIDRIAKRERA